MATPTAILPSRLVALGPFELDLVTRTLSRGGLPVHLRERELSILILLAEHADQFVSRETIIASIWTNTTVSDANLRVQMAALRRMLGVHQDIITFAPRRGYRLRAAAGHPDLTLPAMSPQGTARRVALPRAVAKERSHNLPIRLKPAFGIEAAVQRLTAHLPLHRLVTIIGAGGIGKTTLALASAEMLVEAYEDGICLVDLAGLSDAGLISTAVASALDLSLKSPDPIDDLVVHLRDRQVLLVLDNCEHLIAGCALLVEKILTRTRDVHFLATSREPLRLDGEWLFRAPPLDVPPPCNTSSADQVLQYPAVRLFVERASLSDHLFQLVDTDADAVADLCRRLDGIPLAVELAAARVGLFGVQGLAAQLADSFATLSQGRRTALPRHRTLRATLDWSYRILSERERLVLARIAIFRGDFTMADAVAVAGTVPLSTDDVIDGLAELTAKSLVNVDTLRRPAHYRMLFLTRDYALEKLRAIGEFDLIARRHAVTYLDLLHSHGNEISAGAADTWIDDIRGALYWVFSEPGDIALGIALVTASFSTAVRISSLHERELLLDRVGSRIKHLGRRYPIFELRLLVERISILQFGKGDQAAIGPVADTATELAEQIMRDGGGVMPLVETLLTRISIHVGESDAPAMLRLIEKVRNLPLSEDEWAKVHITLDRMEAQAWHFFGDHARSRSLAERVLSYPAEALRIRHFAVADYINPDISARILISRTQWLQGFPEQASQTALEAVELAAPRQAFIMCYVLGFSAIPIALWRGQQPQAAQLIRQLEVSAATGLAYWQGWARFYQTVLDDSGLLPGEDTGGILLTNPQLIDHATTLCPRVAKEALTRIEAGLVGWNAPEAYRGHGEYLLGISDATGAEACFRRAIDLARTQGARAWELRGAISLAKLQRDRGQVEDAVILLENIIGSWTEGLQDADPAAARRLLDQLTS